MISKEDKHSWSLLLGIHIGIFLLRGLILLLGEFDLFIEEAQYWVWSQKPALSYYSKPPMIAYLNWLSTSLFGSTEFAIKINVLTLGVIYSLLTYQFSFELFGRKKQAMIASLIIYALPLSHLLFNISTTDAPLQVCWALATIYFWRATKRDRLKDWILVGYLLGLASFRSTRWCSSRPWVWPSSCGADQPR